MSETVKIPVLELRLTFGCALEGEGKKCPKNPSFSCIEPVKGVCPYLIAVDSLARSSRRYEVEVKERSAEI